MEKKLQVIVKYHDNSSFLPEEVVRQAEQNYGNKVSVTLLPESDTPIDHLYFAVQRLITGDLLSAYYDSGAHLDRDVSAIKAEFMYKITEVLEDVVHDLFHKLDQES